MGQSRIDIGRGPKDASRPQLLGAGGTGADHNILDAMSSRHARADGGIRPRLYGWLLVLPLLAAGAWLIVSQLQQSPVARLSAPPSPPPAPASVAVAAPASNVPGPSTEPVASASTVHGKAGGDVPASGGEAADPFQSRAIQDASKATVTTVATAVPEPPAVQEATPAVRPRGTPNPAMAVAPAGGRPTAKKVAAASRPPARSRPAPLTVAAKPAKAGTTGGDPDVELLSALMKHLGHEKGQGSSKGKVPARSTQTIAELVKSCEGQDAIETLLCQRRICEGSWGEAQACPLSKAPQRHQTATAR